MLPEENRKFSLDQLGEDLFQDIDRFIIKDEKRENPKLLSLSRENTQTNECIYKWYKDLVRKKIDRIEGKKNFFRLANYFK